LHTKVIVRLPEMSRSLRAVIVGAAAQKEQPMIQVRSGERTMWVPREYVSVAPQPWGVRAARWVKSFIFGEK
jgi:hypothetical protein